MAITFKSYAIACLVTVAIMLSGSLAFAQQQSIKDGVYTETQAQAGKLLYEEKCQHCHDLQFFEGRLISFTGMTVLDLWYAMLGKMPADNPGSLRDSEYLEIIAYALSHNGFPAGETELIPSNQLGKIRILTPQ